MRVEFDTTDFEFSHGRKPRGEGNWAFFFKRHAPVEQAFWASGSFTEAKKQAAAEAKRRNASTVFVGS